jgi:DNA primase
MEISQIKSQLTIANLLHYYGLKTDMQNRLNCPFHDDKTPSMQVYWKSQTVYCFSANCKTHGKSIDVIDFILHKENCSKAQAINKAKEILGNSSKSKDDPSLAKGELAKQRPKEDLTREQFLGFVFQYFRNGMYNSKPAKDYLQTRNLDYKRLEVGYNTGQFHHGARKDETLIKQSIAHGLLIDKGSKHVFGVFGKWCIVFALKNREHKIVSLYFRSSLNDANVKHFYLKDRQGLYPNYPDLDTKKLILTESIIDAASLLQTKNIAENYSVLACYGTNGLTQEHIQAIQELQQLDEIIFAFDNDSAGKEAVKKYAEQFKIYKISTIELPNKDINETLQLHDEAIFVELLENRKKIKDERQELIFSTDSSHLNVEQAKQNPTTDLSTPITIGEQPTTTKQPPTTNQQPPTTNQNPIDFLKATDLLKRLNEQIGKAGIVGEENSRMLLFLIIISYLNKSPLHALVQGSSGSGKTHIISRIADLMPPEDVLRFTRITESSLYNWGEFDLFQKVVIIEDLDGLKEDALYALREFISNQVLRSSVTIKDKKGNNKSSHKIVQGQFSSLSATTKGETYEDNMSRSFLIAVDESAEQTSRIIQYQNKRNAGEIDPKENQKAIAFIQQMVRNLKVYEVINPYATQLHLPDKVHKIRRLNEMYQAVIKQVTFLNQYQREVTNNNQLITEIEDIEQATEVLFESIILKVDELDGSLRQFFERLKKYVKNENQEFLQREIRQLFTISKTQVQRFINTLLELEYIKQSGGYNNKGVKYKISYWDNHQKLRGEIKDFLILQIQQLKNKVGTTKGH